MLKKFGILAALWIMTLPMTLDIAIYFPVLFNYIPEIFKSGYESSYWMFRIVCIVTGALSYLLFSNDKRITVWLLIPALLISPLSILAGVLLTIMQYKN